MIQLIATDMDGTVLSPDHTISKRNIEAIKAAQAQGIDVLIATGRGYPEALAPTVEAGVTCPFICLNGANVIDETGAIVSGTTIANTDIAQIRPIMERHNIEYQFFINKQVFTLDPEQHVDIFIQLAQDQQQTPDADEIRAVINQSVADEYIVQVDSFDALLAQPGQDVYKMFGASYNRADLDRARAELIQIPGIAVSSSGAGNIEITDINAQKGIALEAYAASKNIPMANVMSIGDNYNDLSMFAVSGRSVAMASAPDEIKAACTHETTSNAEDGVALAIEAILK